MKRKLIIRFSLVWIFLGKVASAAPCCSANAAAPSLVSGDDSAQVSISYANGLVLADAPAMGDAVYRNSNINEITQVVRLDGAVLLNDRWQAGASLPLIRHSLTSPLIDESTIAPGDVRFGAAYEILPEWEYSVWRPKGYLFAQITLPTGKSIYDLSEPGDEMDAVGQGFYTMSVGALLLKQWGDWDGYLLPQLSYSLGRTSTEALTGQQTQVGAAVGLSAVLGAGFSPGGGNLRLGLRLQPVYISPRSLISSFGASETSFQLTWDASAEVSYLIAEDWSINGSYSDQTLLGNAVNSTLSRTFAVALQHRWSR
jgi:hypothetical protein